MTPREVSELAMRISASYPRWPISAAALPDWSEDLADASTTDAQEAWRRYRREGHAFPPTSAQLVEYIRSLRPQPEVDDAEAVRRRNAYLKRAGYVVPEGE
jgi:hypothetical protein